MGRDKALLPMGETLLLQRVIDAAAPLSSEHLLITNTPDSHTSFTWPIASDSEVMLEAQLGAFTRLVGPGRPDWRRISFASFLATSQDAAKDEHYFLGC
jgi:hypothetical protein